MANKVYHGGASENHHVVVPLLRYFSINITIGYLGRVTTYFGAFTTGHISDTSSQSVYKEPKFLLQEVEMLGSYIPCGWQVCPLHAL